MKHKIYVYANSEAEERLLYLFEKVNAEYYKELVVTEEGDEGVLYEFDCEVYKAVKQYLEENGES